MLFNPKHRRLAGTLRMPAEAEPQICAEVADARARLAVSAEAAARVDRLIEAGACTDAALALIELELPAWKLRRLVFEDGEWLCSLSSHSALPLELDDTAEARHENMALAILNALVEARTHLTEDAPAPPPVQPDDGTVCCDDFA